VKKQKKSYPTSQILWIYCGGFFDPDSLKKQAKDLSELSESPDFWSDRNKARLVMRKKSQLEAEIAEFSKAESNFSDLKSMLEMAKEENEEDLVAQIEDDLKKLAADVTLYRTECFFSGEADRNSCYLEIHAGAGGTEAQDWASMLLRMYFRWGEAHNYSLELMEESPGEEAGLKSATMKIEGDKAYGWLKGESGVHRLVRISPFDSNARRHTSFASVGVYPAVDEAVNIEINDADLRIDTYRASGAGGQHVNKTESAVRITHIPTGVVVQCQTDRSQHRNRATALEMLRSRLYELELRRKEDQSRSVDKNDIGWGHQIRSYVMQPYQTVKDLRTGFEDGNISAVLDGNLDEFLQASISFNINAEK
jgi:peptide chain release factor 2